MNVNKSTTQGSNPLDRKEKRHLKSYVTYILFIVERKTVSSRKTNQALPALGTDLHRHQRGRNTTLLDCVSSTFPQFPNLNFWQICSKDTDLICSPGTIVRREAIVGGSL